MPLDYASNASNPLFGKNEKRFSQLYTRAADISNIPTFLIAKEITKIKIKVMVLEKLNFIELIEIKSR